MNEYNQFSPNLNNYNSYCIKIQELFEEMLNPQNLGLTICDYINLEITQH
jgi:hypothetical protein